MNCFSISFNQLKQIIPNFSFIFESHVAVVPFQAAHVFASVLLNASTLLML